MTESLNLELLHPLEVKTLRAYSGHDSLTVEQIGSLAGLDAARVRRALEWLLTRNALELVSEETRRYVSLTETGKQYATLKIPELRILERAEEGVTMSDLQVCTDLDAAEISPAVGALKHAKLIQFGQGGKLMLCQGDCSAFISIQELISKYMDQDEILWDEIPAEDQCAIEEHSRKRGKSKGIFRIDDRIIRCYRLTEQGLKLRNGIIQLGLTGNVESQVRPEHLKDGAWRKLQYRKYALDIKPPRLITGKRHPYREFLDFVKRKLTTMGFQEMTGDHVEPEFWNMDALYMPQFHSARDIHDAYFTKFPTHAKEIEEPYWSKVAEAHANGGGTGSSGWGYKFDRDRSRQLVLRSQGTALSSRQLHTAKVPGKYFGMARCFRYDSVDATHAADFFQVEGIVLAPDITFRTLLGLLKMFALEVAKAQEIRFTPAYFPFTEPSVEAHIKHPVIGWMEMGGAGIFRPEVTKPQGVDVPVIAWGLGLDRMAMVAMGIDDIRDLFTTDLNRIRSTRINIE